MTTIHVRYIQEALRWCFLSLVAWVEASWECFLETFHADWTEHFPDLSKDCWCIVNKNLLFLFIWQHVETGGLLCFISMTFRKTVTLRNQFLCYSRPVLFTMQNRLCCCTALRWNMFRWSQHFQQNSKYALQRHQTSNSTTAVSWSRGPLCSHVKTEHFTRKTATCSVVSTGPPRSDGKMSTSCQWFWLRCFNPACLTFTVCDGGRPFLRGFGLRRNLSKHTVQLVLFI